MSLKDWLIDWLFVVQDVMRKYKASVAAVSTDQITIQDQQSTIQVFINLYIWSIFINFKSSV